MASKKDQIDFTKLPISAESLTLICQNKKTKQFANYIKLISDQVSEAEDAVSEVLFTIFVKKKFSNPITYVSALLLYKNVLVSAQMDYYQSQDLFPSQIHQAIAKICEYKATQQLSERGKRYFPQIFTFNESQQIQRLGSTTIALSLQIIQNMSLWYPRDFFEQDKPSRFKTAYQKLKKMNVTFPEKGTFIVMKKQDEINFKNNYDQFIRSNNTQNQTQQKNQSTAFVQKKQGFQKVKQTANEVIQKPIQKQKLNIKPIEPIEQKGLQTKNKQPNTEFLPINNDLKSKVTGKAQEKVSFIIQNKDAKDQVTIPQLKEVSKITSSKKEIQRSNKNTQQNKQPQLAVNSTGVSSLKQKINSTIQVKQDQKLISQRQKQKKQQTQKQSKINQQSKINDQKVIQNTNQAKPKNQQVHLHKKQEQLKPQVNKEASFKTPTKQQNVNFIISTQNNKNKQVERQKQKNKSKIKVNELSVQKKQNQQITKKSHKKIFKVQKRHSPNIKTQQNNVSKQLQVQQKIKIEQQFYNRSPNLHKQKGRSLPKTQKRSVANFFPQKINQTLLVEANFPVQQTFLSGKKQKDVLNQTLSHYRLEKKTMKDPFNQTKRNAILLSMIQKMNLDKTIIPFLPNYYQPTTLQMNSLRRASLNLSAHFQSAQTFFNNKIIQTRLIKSSKNIYILSILNLTSQSLMISPVDLTQGKFTNRIRILNNINSQQENQLFPNSYLDIRFGFNIKDLNFRFLPFFLNINSSILPLTLPITLLDQCQIKKHIDLQLRQQQLKMYGKILKSTQFSMNERDLPKFFGQNNLQTVESARKNMFQSKLVGQCSITLQRLDPLQKPNEVGIYITSVDKNTNKYQMNSIFDKSYPDNEDFAKVIIELLVFLICK